MRQMPPGFEPMPGQWDDRPLAAPRRGPRKPGGMSGFAVVFVSLVVLTAAAAVFAFVNDGLESVSVSGGNARCGPTMTYPPPGDIAHREGEITYLWSPPYGGPHNPMPLPRDPKLLRPNHQPAWAAERAVHNLEHGYVVVWYDTRAGEDDVDAVAEAVSDSGLPKVLVVPWMRGQFAGPPFALTAWGYQQTCVLPDEAAIRAFWDAHGGPNGAAPERLAP